MATVIITLTDGEDDSLDVKADFKGPLDPDSPAHGVAAELILQLRSEDTRDD